MQLQSKNLYIKKKLLLLVAILGLAIPSFEVSYRGMLDLSVGLPTSGETAVSGPSVRFDVNPTIGGLVTTSHGCQITPFLFAGLGGGTVIEWMDVDEYNSNYHYDKNVMVSVPVFIDLRWDLDVRKKITPFVDLKIGYQIGLEGNSDLSRQSYNGYYDEEYETRWIEAVNSFYFQPTAGVRFKGGKRTGFNLGISYLPTLKRGFFIEDVKVDSFSTGLIMLNIGLDF